MANSLRAGRVVGFDANDTLWHIETVFNLA
jgi:hypothetical protein